MATGIYLTGKLVSWAEGNGHSGTIKSARDLQRLYKDESVLLDKSEQELKTLLAKSKAQVRRVNSVLKNRQSVPVTGMSPSDID